MKTNCKKKLKKALKIFKFYFKVFKKKPEFQDPQLVLEYKKALDILKKQSKRQ